MFVYIGNLSLSPIVILFNHGHQHSYLSWCAPPETSKVVQNQQPQDALEFLINGPPRWAKFQQSSPPPEEEGGSMHRSVVDIPVFQYESRKGWTYT
jgi:hypothetical protein